MKLPKQSKPITRKVVLTGEALHEPHLTIDLKVLKGDALYDAVIELVHGINHNDPTVFSGPTDFCGCQILSGQARRMCVMGCGWF